MSRFQGKGKGKGLDACYSATYTSQARDQQRFTISEVAADGATAHYVAIHCPCRQLCNYFCP